MTIREYVDINGPIFTSTFFTADVKLCVNRMLKFNFGSKVMLYTDPTEVNEIQKMALFDNQHRYWHQEALMKYRADQLYTLKKSLTESKENTGTQSVSESKTKTDTGTQIVGSVGSQTNTGTQTNADTGTQTNANTQTNGVVDITHNIKAFDSNTMTSATQDVTAQRVITDSATRTDALTSTRTDNLTVGNTNTDTRTDNLQSAETVSNTRTDDLVENSTVSNIEDDISIKVQILTELQKNTAELFYRIVAEDLVSVLCASDWD